ncbi:MAG TPA: hypothetical protein VFU22_29670, partial [Roseiflexaceae bacterium]|nr:hypothetical protein [Roseiflexaceae bacterium]
MLRNIRSGRTASITTALALVATLLSGCGAPDRSVAPAAAAPTPALATAVAVPSDRLFIRDGFKGDFERLAIVDSISGARERDLPPGVISSDWTTLYVAEQNAGNTVVRALDLASGQALRDIMIPGAYHL